MKLILAIATGGAVGSLLRFWMSEGVHTLFDRAFPYGTLAVNVAGCLLMGFLLVLFFDRWSEHPLWRAAILIGVLGGFTTFSAFSVETLELIERGAWAAATLYVSASLVACVGASWIGVVLGRQL